MGEVATHEAKGHPAASRPRQLSPRRFPDVQPVQSRCGRSELGHWCYVLLFFSLFHGPLVHYSENELGQGGPRPRLASQSSAWFVQYTQDIWIQSSNYSAEVNNANTESEIKFDMRVVDENIFEVLKKDLND
jgi:hypothetical protein